MIDFDSVVRRAREDGIEKFAAGVVVFDEDDRTLLLRRKPDDVLPGIWDYPGGGLDSGEHPRAGALRELFEESGIRPEAITYVRCLDFTDTVGRRVRQFVFTATVPVGTPVALSEHDAFVWADLDDLPEVSDGQGEVLGYLRERRRRPDWRPIEEYAGSIANATMYGAFYFTDTDGRPLGLLSALRPGLWQFPGGDTDRGESPFDTALRETLEETGLDLRTENPEAVARRQLLAVIHLDPTPEWPFPKTGYVFWGGELTGEQLSRIRLTHEHARWRTETLLGWREHMRPSEYLRLMQIDRARRSTCPLYLDGPARHAVDHHGAPRDFEGIVVFVTTPDGRLLMNLRDDRPGIAWPGHWTPIGGWREGNETAFETAAREVREETGVDVRGLRLVPGPRHELFSEYTVALHGTCEGDDTALVVGEGRANRFVPLEEIDELTGPTPPYLEHYLRLIGD